MGRRNRRGSNKNQQNNNNKKGSKQFPQTNDVEEVQTKPSGNTSGERRHVHGRDTEKGANDVNWYTHIYSAAEPLARVSFNVMTGSRYNPLNANRVRPYSGQGGWEVTAEALAQIDPGIMSFRVQPVLGNEEAANTAATQIYSLMRRANAGSTNYDKTDLMMMILAMDSAYMVYEYLLRAYRVCFSWDYLNKYTPEALLFSMGFSEEILEDLANFEAALNIFAYELSTICVPDQFDFIHRHSWLFSNIYEDENNGRAQMYLMNPSRIYIWTEGVDQEPTKLVPKRIDELYIPAVPSSPIIRSVKQVREIMKSVLRPLKGSEDVGTMNGDLAKAFGDGGMIKINPADSTPLVPVHNDEVLEQIMNADILTHGIGENVVYDNLNIEVDYSDLITGPQIKQNLTYSPVYSQPPRNAVKSLLNAYDDISSDRIITSTRLKFASEFIPGSGDVPDKERITACGTEIIESAWIVRRGLNGEFCGDTFQPRPFPNVSSIRDIIAASKFRYHPTMYVFNTSSNKWVYLGNIQDTAITAWLTDEWIKDMHEVCILSEYAVKDYKTGISH